MQKQTILVVQAMRFFAAALVVVYHCQHILFSRGYQSEVHPLLAFGQSGVDVFFVISGFIMVYIGWDDMHKPGAPTNFLIRRLIRIAPTYWFYTLSITAISLALPHLLSQGKADTAYIIASFLFFPWENNIGQIMPVLPVGWTLSYEMYFYLVFAVVMAFGQTLLLPIITLWLLGGVIAGLVWSPEQPILKLATSPLLVEFLMGCVIGVIYKKGEPISKRSALLVTLSSAAIFIFMIFTAKNGLSRVVAWGVPAALLVFGLVFLEKHGALTPPSFLVKLGNASYSLYLSHLFAVHLTLTIWLKLIGNHYLGIFTLLAFVCSLIVAHFSYLIVEKPIIDILNASFRRRAWTRS